MQTGTQVSTQKNKPTDPVQVMQELGIEPNPHNYELFFTFCQGTNANLNVALQLFVDGKEKWSAAKGDALYGKYIADDRLSKILDTTTEEVGNELKSVMEILAQAGEDAANFGETLDGVGGNLENITDPRSIRDVVDHLVKATANMQSRSHLLEKKLAETNQQVESLQTNLDRVKIEAMTDALSGLCNRKRFDEVLAEESASALKSGEPLALVLCDIDHFKRFNDTWGHQTGDQIIRFVSSTLKRYVDDHHVAARYGGEEFAIIMPATDVANAVDVADKIRCLIERKKLVRKSTNEDLGKVTISMGVSLFRDTDEVEDTIERADQALYHSKQSGRNRLTTEMQMDSEAAA
jgi:diguanylate cyclase